MVSIRRMRLDRLCLTSGSDIGSGCRQRSESHERPVHAVEVVGEYCEEKRTKTRSL